MERSSKELDDCCARFLAIGLGLLYLGKGEACEAILEAVQVVEHPINKLINVIVQVVNITQQESVELTADCVRRLVLSRQRVMFFKSRSSCRLSESIWSQKKQAGTRYQHVTCLSVMSFDTLPPGCRCAWNCCSGVRGEPRGRNGASVFRQHAPVLRGRCTLKRAVYVVTLHTIGRTPPCCTSGSWTAVRVVPTGCRCRDSLQVES